MTDFLLELRSEEIPARMQDKARDDLARLFAAELAKAGLRSAAIVTFATPRRLALIARGLPDATDAVSEEIKGPKTSAPPQALEGFLRKTGLARDALTERDGVFFAITEKPGRATAAVLAEAIPAIVRGFPWPKSMRWGAASASSESLRWVRPLHGIVALFGEAIVPVEIAGIVSGATTLGHRFHHPGPITIGSAADYEEKLRACQVLVDQDLRRTHIRQQAEALADASGLTLVEDEGLIAENAGLTEWPEPILGFFDADFLSVPPEVIQLTARVNQKYFVCRTAGGELANAFVCVANIRAADGGAKIAEGNRKVLAARLSDARFFYDTDLKVPLAAQAAKLDRIVFHEKLGTVADKVDRIAKLARWLVEEGIVGAGADPAPSTASPTVRVERSRDTSPSEAEAPATADLDFARSSPSTSLGTSGQERVGENLASLAERAARLCKADLVTGMVGEFPELQGLMGGYYAAAQGEHPAVAAAIRDHYKPVGQGDEVPVAPVTVAVSLADKLDTIGTFFSVDEKPTGSKDPFALRRAAIAVIALVTRNGLRLPLRQALGAVGGMAGFQRGAADGIEAANALAASFNELYDGDAGKVRPALARALEARLAAGETEAPPTRFVDEALDFFADRLKVQQREAGVRHDLIDAVFAVRDADGAGEDDLVRLLARVGALQAFMGSDDGANLLAGYKRAANILKKEGYSASFLTPVDAGMGSLGLSYDPEPDEAGLIAALDVAEPRAAAAVVAEDFEGAMAALASLRAPIDAFFERVTVNDPDPAKREGRLALLARVRAAVHAVADFARIEG